MTSTELKALATAYMQVWNAGNTHILDTHAHEDLTVDYTHFEKPYRKISDYKNMLETTWKYFPDLTISLHAVIPNEDSVTVIWEYAGTHKYGTLFGVEASGKQISVKGMTLLEVENNLVKKESGIVDNFSMLMQLGAMG